MFDLSLLESTFQEYSRNLEKWTPEGVAEVDVIFLQQLGLLNWEDDHSVSSTSLTRCFQVIESPSKITLVNEEFVVWVVPELVDDEPRTYTLVALNNPTFPSLELVYCNSGVYNSSRLVLRILDRLLKEIRENEEALKALD